MKDNKKNKEDASFLAGAGKAAHMMPSKEKMNKDANADPAIKKDVSAQLKKAADRKDENEITG